jgi:hypothetical protein
LGLLVPGETIGGKTPRMSLELRKRAQRVTVEVKLKGIRSRLRPRDVLSSCSYVVVVKASAGLDPEVFIYLAISAELELLQASLVNAYPGLSIE